MIGRKEEKGGWMVDGRDTPVLNSSFPSDGRGRYVFAYLPFPPLAGGWSTHFDNNTQARRTGRGSVLPGCIDSRSYFSRSVTNSCPPMGAGEIRVVRGDKR